MADLEAVKRRFGIIGRSAVLNRAVEVAYQVAPTDLSVLVLGESGSGKEFFPQIIHQYSQRKHGGYIAVNCGAIPEGTIDSELFGHVKGSFTGAVDNRKGYFEEADGGTIFLDEVAELPLPTQARLLRVLESGEFMSVGSSQVKKTDVRIIAATNVRLEEAMAEGKFREDLYYRLSTIPVYVPPLRERGEDIVLLFKWFAQEFGQKYQMPVLRIDETAQAALRQYHWPGNVRQLKNVTEQVSVIERERQIDGPTLQTYLPTPSERSVTLYHGGAKDGGAGLAAERELIYGMLFEMRREMDELKGLTLEMLGALDPGTRRQFLREYDALLADHSSPEQYPRVVHPGEATALALRPNGRPGLSPPEEPMPTPYATAEIVENNDLSSLEEQAIRRALKRHKGHRKDTADELGISERTLYRKLREYNIET